jgi:hypothetical protein
VRKLAAGTVLALGSIGGARLLKRRAARRLRLDIYYEDGAMLSVPGSTAEAVAALARAKDALRAAGRT